MSTTPIDYDALAKQHGGSAVVDYDALAKEHGGIVSASTEPTVQPRSWLDSAKDFASEAWNQVNPVAAVKGLAQAANHPIDTGKGLLLSQAEVENKAEESFKKGDYGTGVRHVLNYLIPVLGPQIDRAGDLMQSGEYAKGAGATVGIGANVAVPELIKGANLKVPVGNIPQRMYQRTLKPGAYSLDEVKSAIDTGLKNDIPITEGGVAKLNDLVTNLQNRVKAQIQGGTNAGATVDPVTIATRADQARSRFTNQVNPGADLDAIDASKQEFLQRNPNPIPVAQAQDLKTGTYQQLQKKYGELSSASTEAQKALARGIKEELEQQFPEIKGLNAQESKFYGLDEMLQRAVKRIDNRDLLSLGGKIATGIGGSVVGMETGHAAGGALGALVMHKILTDPAVQSRLAITLNRAGRGGLPIGASRARVAGYLNQLGTSVNATSSGSADQTSQ
jgi:hypothetical protein